MSELLVIVPTRSRPHSLARVVKAWEDTGAFDDSAELVFLVDADDPEVDEYERQFASAAAGWTSIHILPTWQPLVPKLNNWATLVAGHRHRALGFMGDDHLPRTPGWAGAYLSELRDLGTGIVYGDDGYQHENLPTQWAMTSDIVSALGRMVPAPVDHLYCDNAVLDLGRAAGCIRYLPDVLIEHMHPSAGKAPTDPGYERVNSRHQFRRDRGVYREWVRTGLSADAKQVREIRERAAADA